MPNGMILCCNDPMSMESTVQKRFISQTILHLSHLRLKTEPTQPYWSIATGIHSFLNQIIQIYNVQLPQQISHQRTPHPWLGKLQPLMVDPVLHEPHQPRALLHPWLNHLTLTSITIGYCRFPCFFIKNDQKREWINLITLDTGQVPLEVTLRLYSLLMDLSTGSSIPRYIGKQPHMDAHTKI